MFLRAFCIKKRIYLSYNLDCGCDKKGTGRNGLDCDKNDGVCKCINDNIISGGKCDACKKGFYDHPTCTSKNCNFS